MNSSWNKYFCVDWESFCRSVSEYFTLPVHLFDLVTPFKSIEEYKPWRFSLRNFHQSLFISSLWVSKQSPQQDIHKGPSFWFPVLKMEVTYFSETFSNIPRRHPVIRDRLISLRNTHNNRIINLPSISNCIFVFVVFLFYKIFNSIQIWSN